MQQHEGARMSFGQSASPMQTPMKDQGISSLNYTPLASTAEPGIRPTNYSEVKSRTKLSRYNSPLIKDSTGPGPYTRDPRARAISNFDMPVHRAGKRMVGGYKADSNIFNIQALNNLRGRGQPSQTTAPRALNKSASFVNMQELKKQQLPIRRHHENAPHFKSTVFQHEHEQEPKNTARFLTTYQLTARSMSPLVQARDEKFEQQLYEKDNELHQTRITPGRTKLNNLNSKNWTTMNLGEKCGIANMYLHLNRQMNRQKTPPPRALPKKSYSQLASPERKQDYDKYLSKSVMISPQRDQSYDDPSLEVSVENSPQTRPFHSVSANNLIAFTPDKRLSAYQSEQGGAASEIEGYSPTRPGVEQRLLAEGLRPTKIKPEWLLQKQGKEDAKDIADAVGTSMQIGDPLRSDKRRFYEKLIQEESKLKDQLRVLKQTMKQAHTSRELTHKDIPEQVGELKKRLDYKDTSLVDRMSGDPQKKRYSALELARQKLRNKAGEQSLLGDTGVIQKKERLSGLPSGLSPEHRKRIKETPVDQQVKLPCTSLDVGEVTSEMLEERRSSHHAKLVQQIQQERKNRLEQKMKQREADTQERVGVEMRNRAQQAETSFIEKVRRDELRAFIERQKREKQDERQKALVKKAKVTAVAREAAVQRDVEAAQSAQREREVRAAVAAVQRAQMEVKREEAELARAVSGKLKVI